MFQPNHNARLTYIIRNNGPCFNQMRTVASN